MKPKQISPVEQHFEKGVIALAAVILVGTVYLFWVREPYQVEVLNEQLNPKALNETISAKARVLESKLNSDNVPGELTDWEPPDYATVVREELERPLMPKSQTSGGVRLALSAMTRGVVLSGTAPGRGPQIGPDPMHVPQVPALASIEIKQGIGTIEPSFIEDGDPGWRERRFVTDGPYDVQWVSVAGDFDMAQLREALNAQGAGERQIPASWWNASKFAVLDVQIERQTQLADGGWSESELIGTLPGDPSVRGLLTLDRVRRGEAQEAHAFVFANQWDFIRPAFAPLTGDPWLPPGMDIKDIEDLAGDANATRREQPRRESPRPRRPERRTPTGGPGAGPGGLPVGGPAGGRLPVGGPPGGGMPFAGPAGGRLPVGGPDRVGPTRPDDDRSRTPKPVETRRQPRDAIDPHALLEQQIEGEIPEALIDRDTLRVWTSDLKAKSGSTYRYRMRVVVSNPLYGRELPVGQRELAGRIGLVSDWSPWSEPIKIDTRQYFFLVGAQSKPAPGDATVEVFRYHNGGWRDEQFSVRPGDPIGAEREISVQGELESVDFGTGFIVVDLDFDYHSTGDPGAFDQKTALLLYSDGEQMAARVLRQDRDNPKRRQLMDSAKRMDLARGF